MLTMTTLENTMKTLSRLQKAAGLLLCGGATLIMQPVVNAAAGGDITAVSSRVSDDYIRTKLADGSFQVETYTFGQGGFWAGSQHDDTIDKLNFTDVARVIAVPLAGQNYLSAKDQNQAKLLIMVYWGTTTGIGNVSSSVAYQNLQSANATAMALKDATSENAATSALLLATMENRLRDKDDVRNARLLGYDSEGLIGTDYGRRLLISGALHRKAEDLVEEIEDNRYFVVLMAYDFQLLWKEKKHKLLWETRFSVREHRNDFGKVLPDMAQYASKYFGQDSHGLLRRSLPEGHVTLGNLRVIEVVSEK
jgi:hypothetical protein